jgi:hypothetical protein
MGRHVGNIPFPLLNVSALLFCPPCELVIILVSFPPPRLLFAVKPPERALCDLDRRAATSRRPILSSNGGMYPGTTLAQLELARRWLCTAACQLTTGRGRSWPRPRSLLTLLLRCSSSIRRRRVDGYTDPGLLDARTPPASSRVRRGYRGRRRRVISHLRAIITSPARRAPATAVRRCTERAGRILKPRLPPRVRITAQVLAVHVTSLCHGLIEITGRKHRIPVRPCRCRCRCSISAQRTRTRRLQDIAM